jgi:hypothetical protein
MPVRVPEILPTAATVGVLLDQTPPMLPSVSVMLLPTQNDEGPAIGAGIGSTVIDRVANEAPTV